MSRADYGWIARFGIAVPRANPTVEPELAALLPHGIASHATRLVHAATRVEERLAHYVHHLREAIDCFAPLRLAAFGLGCTGSSYVAGVEQEDALVAQASADRGIPVVTAAGAIRRALRALGIRHIALVSPYPEWLAEAGYRYWQAAGLHLTASIRVDPALSDTHAIYELTSADALRAFDALDHGGAEAIVFSGTGMPTLRAISKLRAMISKPVLSSNLCLAWNLLVEGAPQLAPQSPLDLPLPHERHVE